ncbi:MAG: hypothetical protein RJB14_2878 [Pseudomonadota bacterium]|jgi:hypothetical protein
MNIHQLSVHHDERQDRLLLRLNTQNQQEFRFWLTRRMALRLIPAIETSAARLEAAQPGVAATDAPSQHMLSELKRDEFLQNADFATPFENSATQWPLGPAPLLITDVQLRIQANGTLDISFEDKSDASQARACQLNLQISLVHGMVHLIQKAILTAEWGALGLLSTAVSGTDSVAPPETPRYAH